VPDNSPANFASRQAGHLSGGRDGTGKRLLRRNMTCR
jgi:hypothetical protein